MPNLLLKTAYTSAILVVLSLLGTLTLHADPGVFDDRLVFGQSAALKGPAGALVSACGRAYWRRSMKRMPPVGFMAASLS
jgi:hypothetical protein